MENDPFSSKPPSSITKLSIKQVDTLCKSIVLHVMPADDEKYLLLSPCLIYNELLQHPGSKNKYVNLSVYSPESEQELLELIDTLNLVQPALFLLESANKSKAINARYLQLNKMGHKASSLAFLAKLANKSPSTFRS